jgi:2-oxo-4-hydroxy-4-carboxy-5-ureidoimidazoline decarboxylase
MQVDKIKLDSLNGMDEETFEKTLGGIYEESPWVARAVFAKKPFSSVRALADAMASAVADSEEDVKLALLRAHPDLAGKAALANQMTDASVEEQARAGLAHCTAEELERFTKLNDAYRKKFGWPFILAVRNATKRAILAAFERRLSNDSCGERAECLTQVHKIAYMRLLTKVAHAPTGFLTCHVLDTARGCPAAGMRLTLRRKTVSGEWEILGNWVTNEDGRLPGGPALKGEDHIEGVYEWTFDAGEYFAAVGVPTAGTPFLDEVPIRFGIGDPESHYHVPLLVSPWNCSTYRGS